MAMFNLEGVPGHAISGDVTAPTRLTHLYARGELRFVGWLQRTARPRYGLGGLARG
jgi:hypothetical protein